MTRKSLAVGAGLGLLATGLVGVAPAQAAETLALAPSAGTSYKVLSTSSFKVATGFAGNEVAGAVASLKYRVTNTAGATMTFTVKENGADVTEADVDYGTADNAAVNAADVVVFSSDDNPELGAENSLEIALAPVAATSYTVTVQAWLDTDGGNDIDANEATSPIRTIEFVDHAALTGSVTMTAPVIGAKTLTASATIDGINYDQLDADDVAIKFLANNVAMATTDDTAAATAGADFVVGGAGNAVAARTNPNVAAWSAVTSKLSATFYPENDVNADDVNYIAIANAAGTVYTGQLMLWDGAAYQAVTGAAAGAAPAVGKITALTAPAADNGASVTVDDDKIRAGSGSFTVTSTATLPAGVAKAGHTVTFKIEEGNANELAVGNSFTAGGKTLTNSSAATKQSISVDVVTDALGVATLPITYVGLKDADAVVVTASSNGAAAVITSGVNTFTGEDSLATAIADSIYGGKLTYVKGSAFSSSYTLVDQFGQTPVGTFRLVMSENSGDANFAGNVNVVSGKATFSTVDNSNAAGTYNLTATVQKQALDGSWGAIGGGLSLDTAVNVLAAAETAASITASATDDGVAAAIALELDNTYVGDKTLIQQSVLFPTLADVTTVTFTVKGANGAALVGAPITVSADKAVQLAADSDKLFALGTISGTTDASGQFVVKVYSNFAGKVTLTATSGATSKTQALTFATAKDDTGTTVTASAPAYAKPGTTFKVTFTVTDKYGNPVITNTAATGWNDGTTAPSFSVTYTGPGLIVGSLPTATDANGQASISVLLGGSDTGSISAVGAYDGDTASLTNTTVGSGAAAVTVGSAPAADDTKVNAGSFKGYVAIYAKGHEGKRLSAKVGNDWVVVPVLASNFERVVEFTGAGYTVAVRIYIDRVLIDTITVTTK